MIQEYLDKNNLHHAYLIEGLKEEIIPELFNFFENLGIKTSANPDFYFISLDSFKIEDAHNLKLMESEKSFSLGDISIGETTGKRIFVISANNFLLEAQNTLLKIFEEPKENIHFFVLIPNADTLLKTLLSRFYLIKTKSNLKFSLKEAEKFVEMSLKNRIDFIKELLVEEEKEEDVENNTIRVKALNFLNTLETVLHNKMMSKLNSNTKIDFFTHIFKVREFVNQPGSSLKSLMESIALTVPNF